MKPLWLYIYIYTHTHTGILTKEKGITLMALVITIIVLLILAGISISMLTGDNGIIKRAEEAAKATETAAIKEQIQLAVLDALTEGLGQITSTESLENALQNYVEKNYNLDGDITTGWIITVPDNEISYYVDGNGELTEGETEFPINNSSSLVLGFADDLGTKSTIYLYSNPIQITSGEIAITMPDNSTQTITAVSDNTEISDEANYATYTVTKNGTYTFSVTDGETTTETKIRVHNIETFTPIETIAEATALGNNAYSYKGATVPKGYYVDVNSNVDTGLVITDEIDQEGYATGNEWVWVPVNSTIGNDDYYIEEAGNLAGAETISYSKYSKLYSFSTPRTRDEYGTFCPYGNFDNGTLGKPSQTSGYREPSLLTSYGESTYYDQINNRSTGEAFTDTEGVNGVAQQYITDYNNMITSVDTYGGFYIGRYEISENGEKPGKALSGGIYNWYTLYNECMTFDDEYVTSGMMYGALWDATMKWLSNNYNVGYTGDGITGYGNYGYEAVIVGDTETTIMIKDYGVNQELQTGQTSYTKSNNIYDLSGNLLEWTCEAKDASNRVSRGGNFNADYEYLCFPASRSSSSAEYDKSEVSSRPCLYIK